MDWAVGITTVPERFETYLPQTLASLIATGFDQLRFFVDGDRAPIRAFGFPVTLRGDRIRTAGNWTLALWELYLRQPCAERYAVFQDDFVTYRNLRSYLEKTTGHANAYYNLYSMPQNEELAERRVGWHLSNQRGRGAVALVFSRPAVVELLSARHMVERAADSHRGWRCIDGGIIEAMHRAGYQEMCHYPSLVQHLGLRSSMGNDYPHPQSKSFKGEDYDALCLLNNP